MGTPPQPGPYAPDLPAVPAWLNKGDNAWQLTAATFVGIQSMPGLIVLYGSIVKKKWAVNSAFMALYAYASTLIVWVLLGFRMAFGDRLLPFWGKAGPALAEGFLVARASFPATARRGAAGALVAPPTEPYYPEASLVLFEFELAAITLVLLAGSLLGRMNIRAWMAFTPLVAAPLLHHLRLQPLGRRLPLPLGRHRLLRRIRRPPLLRRRRLHRRLLGGPVAEERQGEVRAEQHPADDRRRRAAVSGMGRVQRRRAVRPQHDRVRGRAQHQCQCRDEPPDLDLPRRHLPRQALCNRRRAGHDDRACLRHRRCRTGAHMVGHTDGRLRRERTVVHHDDPPQEVRPAAEGGRHPRRLPYARRRGAPGRRPHGPPRHAGPHGAPLHVPGARGAFYGGGVAQVGKQLGGALFVVAWNVVVTTGILLGVGLFVPLRVPDDQLRIGDDAAHGEEAYALWGDDERFDAARNEAARTGAWGNGVREMVDHQLAVMGARGVTIRL